MKKMNCIFYIIACMFFLSGCQPMPDEVAENMKRYNDDRRLGDIQLDAEFIRYDNLKEDIEHALSDTYQNLIVPETISTIYPDIVELPVFKIIHRFCERENEVMCDFWGEDIWRQEQDLWNEHVLFDEKRGYYAAIEDRGFVCQIKPAAFNDMFENPGTCIAELRLPQDMLPACQYSLIGGGYTVIQAVEFVNNWFETVWSKYEPGFTFEVSKVNIYQKSDGSCYFTFDIIQLYKGIPLDDMAYMPFVENAEGNLVCKYTVAKKFIKMYECDSIDLFTNSTGIITLESSDSTLSECYSLHTGLQRIEQEFSGFQNIEVSDIELKYMLQPVYNPDNDENFNSPGIQIIAKPVWCIYVDGKIMSGMQQNLNTQKFINISLEDGVLEYQLE